jgi:NADPH2:quinone reductase
VIDEDVPIESAASGVINPMTVIGFVDTFRKWKNRSFTGKGLINTAAASSLGRMLNRFCQKENIPLLNVVRRE